MPRVHAAFEVDDVEALLQQELSRSRRTSTRSAHADDQSFPGQVIDEVGHRRQREVTRHGGVTGLPLVVLSDIEQEGALTQ